MELKGNRNLISLKLQGRDCRAQGPCKDFNNAIRTQFSRFLIPLPGHSLLSHTINYRSDGNQGEGVFSLSCYFVVDFRYITEVVEGGTLVPPSLLSVG